MVSERVAAICNVRKLNMFLCRGKKGRTKGEAENVKSRGEAIQVPDDAEESGIRAHVERCTL